MVKGKVALVTGASSGIGAASARLLAEKGARIAALGRSQDELEAYVQTLTDAGHEAIPVVADISDEQQMQAAIQQIIDTWGRLDIVFANAGINGVWAPIEDLSADEWQKTLDINLTGTFYTVKYAYPHLKKQGGAIAVTASVNGTRIFSNTGATAYACSKAAQVAFVKMTAIEFAPHNVRINVICPGAIETEISDNTEQQGLDTIGMPVEFPKGKIPLTGKKPGTSEQVADLVYFLVSDASSHITGTEVWIDGAESLLQG
ncbi:MAG: 3-oxoacyl-[acyl-carrier-protein] reductase [Anaerolineaceae bacterium]|nr:3-oxoacyl-[acyl-carrier-protein] reductase [Anaerolineaceae bacterium]